MHILLQLNLEGQEVARIKTCKIAATTVKINYVLTISHNILIWTIQLIDICMVLWASKLLTIIYIRDGHSFACDV